MSEHHAGNGSDGCDIPSRLLDTADFDIAAALPADQIQNVPVGGFVIVGTLLETTVFDRLDSSPRPETKQ
jgi:hypothetical protein